MKMTNSAQRWIGALARIYDSNVIRLIVERAAKIARKRKSSRIGRNHLELALEQLADE